MGRCGGACYQGDWPVDARVIDSRCQLLDDLVCPSTSIQGHYVPRLDEVEIFGNVGKREVAPSSFRFRPRLTDPAVANAHCPLFPRRFDVRCPYTTTCLIHLRSVYDQRALHPPDSDTLLPLHASSREEAASYHPVVCCPSPPPIGEQPSRFLLSNCTSLRSATPPWRRTIEKTSLHQGSILTALRLIRH